MKPVFKNNGKFALEYTREERRSNPEKFMTYAKVSIPCDKRNMLIVADYTPYKQNAAVVKAKELYGSKVRVRQEGEYIYKYGVGYIYKYGILPRFLDNGVYNSEEEMNASRNKYMEMYKKSIA